MAGIKALCLIIKAPSSHIRIPQSSNPRYTYEVPPYSTVIGLVANLMGDKALIEKLLKVPFGLSVLCRYETMSQEYTWLRNLETNSHRDKFKSDNSRIHDGKIEHPGGLNPVTFYVLNNVEAIIYLIHPDQELIGTLIDNAEYPQRWISHLHLGRAEDWAALESIGEVELKICQRPSDVAEGKNYLGWVPKYEEKDDLPFFLSEGSPHMRQSYRMLYNRLSGGCSLVPAVYKKVKINTFLDLKKKERITGEFRNFNHIAAKTSRMSIPLNADDTIPDIWCDPERKLPVAPALIDAGTVRGSGM